MFDLLGIVAIRDFDPLGISVFRDFGFGDPDAFEIMYLRYNFDFSGLGFSEFCLFGILVHSEFYLFEILAY